MLIYYVHHVFLALKQHLLSVKFSPFNKLVLIAVKSRFSATKPILEPLQRLSSNFLSSFLYSYAFLPLIERNLS